MDKINPMNIYLINFSNVLLDRFLNCDFPKWEKKENSSNPYKEYECKTIKDKNLFYHWKAYIYEDKDLLKNDIKKNKSNNQIILKFGSDNIDKFLIEDHYVEIGIISEDYYCENKDELNIYLTNIKYDNQNIEKTINKIYIYLHERHCYFNQIEDEKNKHNIDFSINILLTGIARMGKSSFINLLSRKLVSMSNSSFKSVTTKINEYIIFKRVDDNKNIGIKFYDSPGLTDDKNEENENAIELIKNKLSSKLDSKNEIHLIYFFLSNNTILEKHKLFFKSLQEINEDRMNNQNLKKIPIIFVFNRTDKDIDKFWLKEFLEEFNSLIIENIPGTQSDKTLENDNIIDTNLVKSKKKNLLFQFMELKNY